MLFLLKLQFIRAFYFDFMFYKYKEITRTGKINNNIKMKNY